MTKKKRRNETAKNKNKKYMHAQSRTQIKKTSRVIKRPKSTSSSGNSITGWGLGGTNSSGGIVEGVEGAVGIIRGPGRDTSWSSKKSNSFSAALCKTTHSFSLYPPQLHHKLVVVERTKKHSNTVGRCCKYVVN